MVEPVDNFLSLKSVVELVSDEAAVAPEQARNWINTVVNSDAVRLRDPDGSVMRYSQTPEVKAVRATRIAQGPAPARYNPFSQAHRRYGVSSTQRSPSTGAQIWAAGYAVNLGDLEKALGREFNIQLDLCAAASKRSAPAAVSSSAGPIERLRDMFRRLGLKPDFEGWSKPMWKQHAQAVQGILFIDAEFEAAWNGAKESGEVVPLIGPPKRELRKAALRDRDLSPRARETPAIASKKVADT